MPDKPQSRTLVRDRPAMIRGVYLPFGAEEEFYIESKPESTEGVGMKGVLIA